MQRFVHRAGVGIVGWRQSGTADVAATLAPRDNHRRIVTRGRHGRLAGSFAGKGGGGAGNAVTPDVGSISITGYAPTVVQATPSQNITPDVGAITITGYAPTVTQTRATQAEGGGWMPPRGRRKTRKEVYAERVRLGILPPAIVRAAEKVAVVAETVAEFKADRPRYEEMFMRELSITKWSPSYTRAIQIQIELMQQDDEDILLLMM